MTSLKSEGVDSGQAKSDQPDLLAMASALSALWEYYIGQLQFSKP